MCQTPFSMLRKFACKHLFYLFTSFYLFDQALRLLCAKFYGFNTLLITDVLPLTTFYHYLLSIKTECVRNPTQDYS